MARICIAFAELRLKTTTPLFQNTTQSACFELVYLLTWIFGNLWWKIWRYEFPQYSPNAMFLSMAMNLMVKSKPHQMWKTTKRAYNEKPRTQKSDTKIHKWSNSAHSCAVQIDDCTHHRCFSGWNVGKFCNLRFPRKDSSLNIQAIPQS